MTADQIHDARAKREYEAIKGFYIHFVVYVGVNLLLVAINVLTGGPMWAQWPVLGWGIGILAHAYCAFVKMPKRMAAWESEQLARLSAKG